MGGESLLVTSGDTPSLRQSTGGFFSCSTEGPHSRGGTGGGELEPIEGTGPGTSDDQAW